MIGTTLSHYEITAELGRGGMGIVYKARDTKLDREVAIKVLPSAALASADDRERFYREAKSAAALNHPNIAQVYQIDEAVPSDAPHGTQPSPFIAMEFISGGTLQDRIKDAPLSLPDAVKIASQVAEALKAAHAKDIVHRDIKSANVMITEDGVAKVLDFGLAKTNQSTMLTRMGSTLGTVAYMSPEQARGQEVDGRTDLYSLGTMLYEMVAGRLPFSGEYEQAVVYSILNEPPEPLTSLRTGVPMQLEWIVNKLMAKDADYRYQTAGDLQADLKALDLSGSGMSRRSMPAASAAAMPAAAKPGLPVWVYGAIAGALLIGAAAAWLAKPVPEETPSAIVSFPLELESILDRTGRRSVAISPDGQYMAYVTPEGIRMQRMNDLGTSTLLVSIEERTMATRELFFSPDSRWLGFEDDQNDRLMRVDVSGGSPVRMTDLPGSLVGVSWAANGDIFLGLEELGIGRLPRGSGTIEMVIEPDSTESTLTRPSLLSDGRYLLYSKGYPNDRPSEVRLRDLESGADQLVLSNAYGAQFISSGHLVFISDQTLYANPFDPSDGQWEDARVPVMENVMTGFRGTAHYDLSNEGTLVVASETYQASGQLLAWSSEDRGVDIISDQSKRWGWPDLSPDGRYIVAEDIGNMATTWDLWIVDTTDGTTTRLTSNGRSTNGVWAPDGKSIAHTDNDGFVLIRYLEDASRVDTLLHQFARPTSWSRDGKYLFLELGDTVTGRRSVAYLNVETRQVSMFPAVQDGIEDGNISPNGRWVAFEMNDGNGSQGIYVLPFPEGGDPRLISSSTAFNPRWSADGRQLYYQYPGGTGGIAVSEFDPETGVSRIPRELDLLPGASNGFDFAVHPDGRVVVAVDNSFAGGAAGQPEGAVLRFIKGFDDLLRERAGSDD